MAGDSQDSAEPGNSGREGDDARDDDKTGATRRSTPLLFVRQGRRVIVRLPRRRRVAVAVGAAVLLLLIGAAVYRLLRTEPEPGPTAAQVVADFFHAQRDDDCRRLLEVVSEASWSGDGERSREDFLEQCAEVVEDYEPAVESVSIEYDEHDSADKASVRPSGVTYDESLSYGEDAPDGGRLVREDGGWRVVTDEIFFRIGPPAAQALHGYLDAYNAGGCEAMTTYTTDRTWSAGGRLEREEFLEQCADAVDARGPSLPEMSARSVEIALEDDGEATVSFSLQGPGGDILIPYSDESATATMVKEGLQWRLDHSEAPNAAPAGTFLSELRYGEVQASLPDDLTLSGHPCLSYSDRRTSEADTFDTGMHQPDRMETELGISRTYSCDAAVTIFEFADDETAREAAEQLAEERLEWERLTLEESIETSEELGSDETVEEVQARIDRQRPPREVDVPNHADALGVRSLCNVDDCLYATAFLPRDHMVIGVHSQIGSLEDVSQLLTAQVEAL